MDKNKGLNCLLFSYEELREILNNKNHPLYFYISRWFGDDAEDNTLYFSENCVEVEEGDFWLVNIKTDYAIVIDNLDELEDKIEELLNK